MISFNSLPKYPIPPSAPANNIYAEANFQRPSDPGTEAHHSPARPQPDKQARADKVWIPPRASVASRRPAKRSRGSFRGSFVNPRTNREIVFESIPERNLAYIALAASSVADLREQVGPVKYFDENGKIRQHTIDLVADMKSGTSIAFFVKPANKVESSGVRKTRNFIREQQPSVADQFEVRTEEHITRNRAANARLLHRALRSPDNEDIATVLTFVRTLRGSMTIRAVLSVTRNDGFGFMALLCLIADGVLEHVGPGLISRDTFVRLSRTTETKF
jgi:hypothetical protein